MDNAATRQSGDWDHSLAHRRRWDAPVDVAWLDEEIPIAYRPVDDPPRWPGGPMTLRQASRHAAAAEADQDTSHAHLEKSEGMTLREIGRELGVTPERVRQIEARALRKLRGELTRRAMVEGLHRHG